MLKQRTITALVLAPLGVAMVLLLPTAAMAALTAVTVLVALWEWTRMAGFTSRAMRSGDRGLIPGKSRVPASCCGGGWSTSGDG